MSNLFKERIELLKNIAYITTLIIAVGSFLFWAFQPRLEEQARIFIGTEELIEAIKNQEVRIGDLYLSVGEIENRLNDIAPIQIVEYDEVRSVIDPVCYIGESCNFSYRVRRTEYGDGCRIPNATSILVDLLGTMHFVEFDDTFGDGIVRLTDRWSFVDNAFIITEESRIAEGISEFYIIFKYEGCEDGSPDGESKTEFSFPLVTTIVKR